jgi:Secretion system C-terminal sorting domain
MPFRRVLVKSRASTSFTSELKDFVGPFDFFLAPRVLAAPTALVYCGVQSTVIKITNASPTSTYNWTTTDGSIIGSTTADSVIAGTPGSYMVTQRLQSGCSIYAMDTVTLVPDVGCVVLPNTLVDFRGALRNQLVQLNWTIKGNQDVQFFDVETSTDNSSFEFAGRVYPHPTNTETADYTFTDNLPVRKSKYVYYRLKITSVAGNVTYSKIISIPITQSTSPQITITPNPVKDLMQVSIYSPVGRNFQLSIYDYTGRQLKTMNSYVQEGASIINLSGFENWPNGVYVVKVLLGNELFTERVLITSK